MPARTIKDLKKRRDVAIKRRDPWEASWRDAYRYVLPQRDVMDNPHPGQVKGQLVFDSTAVVAASQGANRIQQVLFPPFQDFVTLETGPAVPEQIRDRAHAELQQISETLHAAFRRSNFDVMINEFCLDLLVGTATMLFNQGQAWNPFEFHAVPAPTVALEEGPWGTIAGFYRCHKCPVGMVQATWPRATNLPSEWVEKLKHEPTEEVEVHEASYEIHEERRWYYDLYADEPEHRLMPQPQIFEGQGPWIGSRYMKAANEVWGRGPVLQALADIRTANAVKELILKNGALSISGVYTGVDDGVMNPNTVRIVPGAVIPVARNEGPHGPTLMPLPRAGDFDVSQILLTELREDINRYLFASRLPPDTAAVRTATEIIARQRELQVDIGPAFGRLMRELMTPLVMRGLQILQRLGLIGFPVQIDGTTVQITVTSPLARQNNLDDLEALMNAIQMTSMLGPEMVQLSYKVEEIGPYIARKLGVDAELIRDDTERAQLMQIAQQMAAQMMAQAQQQGQAPGRGNGSMALAA